MEYIYPNLPSRCTWRLDAKPVDSVHCHQPKFEKQPKVLPNILHAVGNTPLIRLNKIPKEYGIKCEMYAKCEFFNPGGSVKDRVALRMIEEAERNGKVKPGAVFIEPTTGNTGIAMALAAAIKGYSCINVVPEHISAEKMTVMRALGAEIIKTPRTALIRDENSLHRIAQKLSETIPDSIVLDQCRNPENPLVHYDTTAEEIIDQLDGNIDMIVLGAGTGATVSGLGRKFKEKVPTCKVVVCDPYGHAFAKPENLENGVLATCEIESVGLTFYSTVLDVTVVDEWVETTDKEAFQMARSIIRKEGLLCGESSGSVLCAALKAAKDLKEGQKCVLLFGDGVRNSMTRLLNDDWLASRGFIDINPEMAEKHWWWNLKVSSLSLATPSSISPNVYCQNAIARMKKKASDILIVVDDTGKIKGVVTLKSMMSRIMTKKLTSSTKVSEILDTNHREITTDTSLGQLSRILSQEGFALVVDKHKQCLSETDDGKHMLAAVVKQIDLVDFIVNKNKMTLPINSYEKVENDKSQLDIEICSLGP